MFGGRSDRSIQELIWPYAAPLVVGVVAFVLLNAITGGIFPLFEIGIAIAVAVFVRRMMLR
jgi:hypothetical protein